MKAARTENQNLRERLRSLAILADRPAGEPKVIPDAEMRKLRTALLPDSEATVSAARKARLNEASQIINQYLTCSND